MARDDFSSDVKKNLALRAGYQCSICSDVTVGPSHESPSSVNITGVAAHIAAASPGGRRYLPWQSTTQRSSIENGIWLCNHHADLIDGDENTYTIDWLIRAKNNHEQKIQFQQQHFDVSKGMITSMELCNLGLITNYTRLDFSSRNIILGYNGTGKTLICEMIAALANRTLLSRWKRRRLVIGNGFCHVHYFKNEPSKFTIAISDRGKITYKLNDIEYPFLNPAITVFYPNETLYEFVTRILNERKQGELSEPESVQLLEDDLIYWLASYFLLEKEELKTVIQSTATERKYFIRDLRLNADGTDLEVNYGTHLDLGYHSFHSFSGGEKQRIILEICLKIAAFCAKFKPTVLLMEHTSFGTIDSAGINHLLGILKQEELTFQFFFTTMLPKEKLALSGYMVWELKQSADKKSVNAVRHKYE